MTGRFRYRGTDESFGYTAGRIYKLHVDNSGELPVILSPHARHYGNWPAFYTDWQVVGNSLKNGHKHLNWLWKLLNKGNK